MKKDWNTDDCDIDLWVTDIEANYFANHQQKMLQPVTVQAEAYTDFGRPNQKKEILALRLLGQKEVFLIGKVEY